MTREAVTFAGAYFDILLWALATLIWRVTNPETWVSFAALVVMATAGIKTLFNLNPLIKLDGYDLLSDALDIPNLRARAFAFLKTVRQRLLGTIEPVTLRETPRHEQRIFLAYGLLAGVYSVALLGSVAWWVGGFLTTQYQGPGFLVFSGLLSLAFRRPLTRSFLKLPERLRAGPA